MRTAQQLFDENFTNNPTREKRSKAYKVGVMAVLNFKIHGVGYGEVPFKAGTAAFDAYFAGIAEGNNILVREN